MIHTITSELVECISAASRALKLCFYKKGGVEIYQLVSKPRSFEKKNLKPKFEISAEKNECSSFG